MKRICYFMMTIILLCLFMNKVNAVCSDDEYNSLKKEIDKVTISYKHLGGVSKEDGSIVYNEFIVTASKIPNDVYVHLYPMTSEKFVVVDNSLKIKLTTGSWQYNFYSSKCEKKIGSISFKLPTFNIYLLDSLCEGVDSDDFKLCGKYYESYVSREDFEKRVMQYKQLHTNSEDDNTEDDNDKFIDKIINFVLKNYLYIIGLVVFVVLIIFIVYKRNKKKGVYLLK